MNTPQQYQDLWDTMIILKTDEIEQVAKSLYTHKERYEKVVQGTKLPWQWVACIHQRESGARFTRHLHNGDPLTAKTVLVPKGRPVKGQPPFTWEESAIDALFEYKELDKIQLWDIPTILFQFEKYNGLGYAMYRPEINSPYLWSYTTHYKRGKYAADGAYDPELKDKQIGCAPLFRYLTDKTLGIAQ